MKLGLDAREFVGTGRTGIGRYLENLLTPLIQNAAISLALFAYRRDYIPESLRLPSVKIVELPALPTPVLDQVSLPLLARRENIDVFLSPYYKVPLFGQFKRIITVHDIMFLRQKELSRFTRFLIARQLRAATRKADIILVSSDFTGKDLTDFTPRIQRKIRRLYPDLSSAWLKPIEPADIGKLQKTYADGKSFLLYVGNFNPHKNVDLLVRAFAQLVKEGHANDRRLLLVGGDIKNQHRIEALISKYGMGSHIMIHCNVSDEELRGLYVVADWFVTASSYEGFGYPVVEAMAAGCPVICYPRTSLWEIGGNAPLEIPSLTIEGIKNALQHALSMQPAEKLRFVERGKKQAKQFLPGTTADNFSSILSTLV